MGPLSDHTHRSKTSRWLAGTGAEIGAFTHPVDGIKPIYVDKFREYAGQRCLADYQGEAESLPFYDNSLDYIVASHVLEHVANPVRALVEWCRVLRPGGVIYLVVPDKRFTFDHGRSATPISHLLDDFEKGTTSSDPTHIDEFIGQIDWKMHLPNALPEEREREKLRLSQAYRAACASGQEINIHFHVFLPETVRELFGRLALDERHRLRWRIVDFAERFPADRPDGILAVVKVDKRWRERAAWIGQKALRRLGRGGTFPILPDAKRFD